jgi:hypothetical protein
MNFVLSAVDVAVMVTTPPEGTAEGAVYVVAAPLAVCAGLNDPQVLAGTHVQSTPAFDESLVTAAMTWAVVLTSSDAGGAVLKAMAIAGGVVPPPLPELGLELPPPQATSAEIMLVHTNNPIRCFIVVPFLPHRLRLKTSTHHIGNLVCCVGFAC